MKSSNRDAIPPRGAGDDDDGDDKEPDDTERGRGWQRQHHSPESKSKWRGLDLITIILIGRGASII